MEVTTIYDQNAFLFTDDEENRIYVEWEKDKSELFDEFIDEYEKLVNDREGEYDSFYEELQERLNWKMRIKVLDSYVL